MTETEFWRLIDRLDWTHQGDDDLVVAPVVKALAARDLRDIYDFEDILAEKLHALDGRAWARESGPSVWRGEPDRVSEDAFLQLRCVVVAKGEAYYAEVLADPRKMPKDHEFEALLFIHVEAWERKTLLDYGDDYRHEPELSWETFSNEAGWPGRSTDRRG